MCTAGVPLVFSSKSNSSVENFGGFNQVGYPGDRRVLFGLLPRKNVRFFHGPKDTTEILVTNAAVHARTRIDETLPKAMPQRNRIFVLP